MTNVVDVSVRSVRSVQLVWHTARRIKETRVNDAACAKGYLVAQEAIF